MQSNDFVGPRTPDCGLRYVLHQLADASEWAQGDTDASHKCWNLNGDNVRWLHDFSMPVEVRNTANPSPAAAQNGTVP